MPRNDSNLFNKYFSDDSGAVTVDWVVLTAALVGLGLAVMAVVSGGIENLASDTDTQLTNTEISDRFAEVASAFGLTADNLSSWHHNEGWYNATTANYSDPNITSPAQLIAQYNAMAAIIAAANPADIASGHYQNAIDHMGALEIGMAAQGITPPNVGTNYQTAYTNYQATL